MEKQYRFIADSVNSGRTVLVYDWPVQSKVYHVSDMSRVAMHDSILHIDGKPAIGKTIALKPKSWRNDGEGYGKRPDRSGSAGTAHQLAQEDCCD